MCYVPVASYLVNHSRFLCGRCDTQYSAVINFRCLMHKRPVLMGIHTTWSNNRGRSVSHRPWYFKRNLIGKFQSRIPHIASRCMNGCINSMANAVSCHVIKLIWFRWFDMMVALARGLRCYFCCFDRWLYIIYVNLIIDFRFSLHKSSQIICPT